jgi:probable HAF family extracellular repeat protein
MGIRRVSILVTALVVVAFRAAPVTAEDTATIIDLGTLGGRTATAIGINDLGDVVGVSFLPGNTVRHAFFWNGGPMVDLGTLPGRLHSQAIAINNRHQAVGFSHNVQLPIGFVDSHAVRWDNAVISDLNTPAILEAGWMLEFAFDINDAGQIVGAGFHNGARRAFLLDNGVVTDLGTLGGTTSSANAINRFGDVVGSADTAGNTGTHAFLWRAGSMTDLGSIGGFTGAGAINDWGDVAGTGQVEGSLSEAILWTNGTLTVLPRPAGIGATTAGINNLGQVVGTLATIQSVAAGAMLWQQGAGIDIKTLIAGYSLLVANDINDAGQIVGHIESGGAYILQLPTSPQNAEALVGTLIADEGVQTSLLVKIADAAQGGPAACNRLRAAMNEVNAQSGRKIDAAAAGTLLATLEGLADGVC